MDEKEKNLEENLSELEDVGQSDSNGAEAQPLDGGETQPLDGGETQPLEMMNDGLANNDADGDVSDDLEEKDGVRYETNDNWTFDADAPSLNDDFILENEDFEIEIKDEDILSAAEDKTTQLEGESVAVKAKKPKNELLKFIPLAIFVAAVIAALVVLGIRYYTVPNGKEGNMMNPGSVVAEIDGVKVSTGMFNYYYSSLISYYEQYAEYGYFDLDTSVDYSEQYTTDENGNEISWADYFKEECLKEIETTTAYYSEAKKAGVELTKSQQETIDSQIDSLKETASEEGLALNDYIELSFGDYCSENTLRLMLEQYYLTTNYRGMLAAQSTYSQGDIDAYYTEHEDEFKQITFSYLAFVYDMTDDDTKKESIETAEKYMARMTDADSVNALVEEAYADYIENDIDTLMESNESLSEEDARAESIANYEANTVATILGNDSPFDDETTNWLMSSDTAVGSTNYYIDEEVGYIYVILKTAEPTVDDATTYSVRHILIMPEADESENDSESSTETTEYTDEQWAAAEEKAQSILDEFNGGDKSEYSFALLAEENSTDTASTSAGSSDAFGGLYEGVTEGEMVSEFESWALDSSRKYGDTGIVKSTYGYHIMFFVNTCKQYESDIIYTLRNNQLDSLADGADVKLYESAIDRAIESYYSDDLVIDADDLEYAEDEEYVEDDGDVVVEDEELADGEEVVVDDEEIVVEDEETVSE